MSKQKSNGELQYSIQKQEKHNMFVNHPSESTIKCIMEVQTYQHPSVSGHCRSSSNQSSTRSQAEKSRNNCASADYFSFSHLEGGKAPESLEGESSCSEVQVRVLERSETMVQIVMKQDTGRKLWDLTGDVLDIIAEYLDHRNGVAPMFTLSCSRLVKQYAFYKRENFAIQNEILQDQIAELNKELYDYFDQKLFKMSRGL